MSGRIRGRRRRHYKGSRRKERRGIMDNSLLHDTSSFEESDKSMTSSKPGFVFTLITGGVLKSTVDNRRRARIFVDSPS
jgi:hypothetical protein